MYNTMFYIIVLIIVISYLLERYLTFLNSKKLNDKLPNEINDVYDTEKYKKSQEYKKVNDRFSLVTSTFGLVVILVMLFAKGFSIADDLVREVAENPIVIALLFFGLLMLVSDIINMPFSIYDTFVIEAKFEFNKTTPVTYVLDRIKGWLLTAILGGGILAVIVWFYLQTTSMFWIYAWALIVLFMLFMTMFYSNLIVPLFNKQTPLENGELKDEISNFCQKVGFKLKNIYVINGSKRSTKANAYFTGLGAKKRIVLYDTLIADLTKTEIVAVLAHEIGHYKKKHTLTGIILSMLQTGITLYIFSLFVDNPRLSQALGANQSSFHIGVIAFGILYTPISLASGLFMNIFSRKNEFQADRFVKENYRAEELISSLKKLSSKNLSNLTPHPLYVFFHYSHPTLYQRICALK